MMGNLQSLILDEVSRMMKLAQSDYRPPEIVKLKREIEEKTRLAKTAWEQQPELDHLAADEIARLKLQLDGLFVDWVRGEIF